MVTAFLRRVLVRISALLVLGAVAGGGVGCGAEGEASSLPPGPAPHSEAVWISGSNDGQQPGFWIGRTEVTVAQFDSFVMATNYVTEAEDFGWSGVFNPDSLGWTVVDSATYLYPLGPAAPAAAPDHPATHLSFRDITAYADWVGGRVPTEAEWVWAASQGGTETNFPWGDAMVPDPERYPGNWWQGPFPLRDDVADGYPGVAPVASFPPAPNGLFDISGNVWEWTATRNPRDGQYVIRGGSFLCSTSYCTGFSLRQRQGTPGDSGLNHLGMRVIW